MKILFLVPYPLKQSPSQRFRFEQYFDLLHQQKIGVDVKPFLSEATWLIIYKKGNYVRKVAGILRGIFSRCLTIFTVVKYNYVFIHREAIPIGPPLYEFIIAKILQKKIIYDFDDAIWLPNASEANNWMSGLKWHSKVGSICRWSYKISCGNDYLCNYAKKFNQNVILNPTTIDTTFLHNPELYKKEICDKIVIGWTGTHSTLKYLEDLIPVLHTLENKFPGKLTFLVIADRNPSISLAMFKFLSWSKATEISDLLRFDIGVMPLTDDLWAYGKCGFKALQYMALEIPAVISPIGVNNVIVENEIDGYFGTTAKSWELSLSNLIEDSAIRKKIGHKAREKVIRHYSVISNSENFLSLFRE